MAKLYVGNLSFETNEDQLKAFFALSHYIEQFSQMEELENGWITFIAS